MTRAWDDKPDWSGKTVVILASGPSMNAAVVSALSAHVCIAVNFTHLIAPDADMLVALDLNLEFWAQAERFAGIRLCGVDSDRVDACYIGPRYETIEIAPGHVVSIRNSGLAAIRIAAELGAARIILTGFDPDAPGHFAGRPHAPADTGEYFGLAEGLRAIVKEMTGAGIEVEFFSAPQTPSSVNTADPIASKRPAALGKRGP